MRFRSVRDLDVAGKRVLVRVDVNVPKSGATDEVRDFSRVDAIAPTVQYLRDRGARVIIAARFDPTIPARRLEQILSQPISVAPDCVGPGARAAVNELEDGDVMFLGDLALHSGEKADDPSFAAELASLAELYINEAFPACHRPQASTTGIARILPSAAGLRLEQEVDALTGLLVTPLRPFACLAGGTPGTTKVRVLLNLLTHSDLLLVGGGMALAFLAEAGCRVGRAVEAIDPEPARGVLKRARREGVQILTPTDLIVADEVRSGASHRVVETDHIPDGSWVVDVGPATVASYLEALRGCATVFWNGPFGVFEVEPFDAGTNAIATGLAGLNATTVVGGGHTVAAVRSAGLADRFSHVSTGGGAALELLAGLELPGLRALPDR